MKDFGGVDLKTIKDLYGTPVYLVDLTYIDQQIALFKHALGDCKANLAYASKAFLNTAMVQVIKDHGLFIDCVSRGEIYTALQAGMPGDRIIYHGNNKTEADIRFAIEHGVGRFVIDNEAELTLLKVLSYRLNKKVDVLVRINPQVKVDTHKFISTGHQASKFGFPLDLDLIMKVFTTIHDYDYLNLLGVHFHVGSQLMTPESHCDAISALEPLFRAMKDQGISLGELNLGGGFGVDYLSDQAPYDLKAFIQAIMLRAQQVFKGLNMPQPAYMFEPGRSLIARAGVTLYEVGHVKTMPHAPAYINVDGGLFENLRPALYGAKYRAAIVGGQNGPLMNYSVVGSCCESGDVLIDDISLAGVSQGDLMVVMDTGAYHHSMSNNYNKHLKPPVVFVKNGEHQLVTKRETHHDLVRLDQPLSL